MDKAALGRRLVQAREAAGMTQDRLGRAVDLDRTAITRLESGERRLNVTELVAIAHALQRPLSYFVNEPISAVVNRRSSTSQTHLSTQLLDSEIDQFAADVRTLLSMKLVEVVRREPDLGIPKDHVAAELMAESFRSRLKLGPDPIQDLGETCERLGLFTYSALLGIYGPDGGCVELNDAQESLGAAVINGNAPPGRRRMTLAHELGHWLSGDANESAASLESEKLINSFAIYFLAPRAGVSRVWNEHPEWPERDRALAVGATFRLSWSATASQLRNIDLIDNEKRRTLTDEEPRWGDYLRIGASWTDELGAPYLSPAFVAACVTGYTEGRLTEYRTIELLRATLAIEDLPRQNDKSLDDLKRSFEGHDA